MSRPAPRFVTVGVRRRSHSRLLFIDVDGKDFDIYETRHGIHLVAKMSHRFDYHFRRIRVSPKVDMKGREVSSKPGLLFCHCPKGKHHDKRKGRIEVYITGSD